MNQARQIVTNLQMRIQRQQRVRAPGAAPATLSQQQPPQLSKRTRLQGRGWMQSMAFRIVTTTQRPTTMRRMMDPTHNNSKPHRSRTNYLEFMCEVSVMTPQERAMLRHLQQKAKACEVAQTLANQVNSTNKYTRFNQQAPPVDPASLAIQAAQQVQWPNDLRHDSTVSDLLSGTPQKVVCILSLSLRGRTQLLPSLLNTFTCPSRCLQVMLQYLMERINFKIP